MKFLKIISCVLVIASIGYFAMQSYKRSNIEERIKKIHNPSKKINDTEAGIYIASEDTPTPIPTPSISDRDLQIWADAKIIPSITKREHNKDETTNRQVSAGKIFSSVNNDKIRISSADREYAITNTTTDSTTFDLYKKIADILSQFVDELTGIIEDPVNAQYKPVLRALGSKRNPLPYEIKIINALKYGTGFCTVLLGQLQGAIDAKQISATTQSVIDIKQVIETTRTKIRNFAFNYFGLIFS